MNSKNKVILPTPEKNGYTFEYWKDSAGNKYQAENNFGVDYDLTLTAVWVKNTSNDNNKNNVTNKVEDNEKKEEINIDNPKTGNNNIYIIFTISLSIITFILCYNNKISKL